MGMIETFYVVKANNDNTGPDGDSFSYIGSKNWALHLEIQEVPAEGAYVGGAFVGQGLNYKLKQVDGTFSKARPLVPGDKIILNDLVEEGNAGGRVLGHPSIPIPGMPNNPNTSPTLVKISSATATPSNIRVREWT